MGLGRRAAGLLTSLRNGSWLTPERLRVYPAIFLVVWLAVAGFWVATAEGVIDRTGKVLGTDFLNVWAASAMTLEGRPAESWDWPRHAEVERRVVGADHPDYYGWHYPPLFLLVAAPLALLPYLWALALYLAATFPAYWSAVRRILPERPAILPILAFPGLWINLMHGQNGFLTVGLMGGGLLLLDRRPLLAGMLLGLLAYKPQFGLLLPLALIAGGHWRVLAGAGLSLLATVSLSLWLFGVASWRAFFGSLALTRTTIIEQGATGWHKIQSVFSAVRMLGGGIGLAYAIQGGVLLVVVIVVVAAWRKREAPLALKAAVLVAATPLTTPYVLDYDLVLLALPVAWLVAEGRRAGFRPWEKTLLVLLWLLPVLARQMGELAAVPMTPLLLALLLTLLWRRLWRSDRRDLNPLSS